MIKTVTFKKSTGFIFFCVLCGVLLLPTNAKAFQNQPQNNQLLNDFLPRRGDRSMISSTFLNPTLDKKDGFKSDKGTFSPESPTTSSFGFLSKITAPPTSVLDEFGWSVAIDGDTAIVSDPWEDVGSNTAQGAAYIFVKSNGLWLLQQTLTAPNAVANERFGFNVALQGNTAVVSSIGVGSQQTKVFIFVRNGSVWALQKELSGSGTEFINSAVPAIDGDTLAVGSLGNGIATSTGVVFVFVRNGTDWTFQTKLFASDGELNDNFGNSVAVSGNSIIVGAKGDDIFPNTNQGSAYIFNRIGTSWTQETKFIVPGFLDFGTSCDLEGNTAVIANGGTGQFARAFVFVREGGNWNLQSQLQVTDPNVAGIVSFGTKLDLSGNNVVINASRTSFGGNSNEGAAYIFTRSGTTWSQSFNLYAPDRMRHDNFSTGVGISGTTVIVGTNRDNFSSRNLAPGSAYIFSDLPEINTDLRAASDHGESQTDNNTNTRQLSIDVGNVTPGATVELYRDNVLINSQIANANSVAFNDTVPSDGQFQYNSREVINNLPSPQSGAILVTVDTIAPTVTINHINQNDPTSESSTQFLISLSESRTSFSPDFVSLAESTANLSQAIRQSSGSEKTFGFQLTNIISNGQFVRATIPGGTYTDVAGNFNLPSTSTDNTVTIDNVRPTVTVNQAPTQIDPTRNLPLVFEIVFSEPVTDFISSEVAIGGSTANTIGAIVNLTGSGAVYTATITGINSNGGYVQAGVNQFAAMDMVGNSNFPSTSTDNRITIDNVRPTVTINQAPGQSDPTAAQPLNYRVVFSEPVTGFDSADITLANSTANVSAASIAVTGTGPTYNVTVRNVTSGGLIRAGVVANSAEDSLGNLSTASTSTDNTISFVFRQKAFDFDGDGKTDIGIFRASDGSWWYSGSSDSGSRVYNFGTGTDFMTPGDFTGDGKADIAVWRPSDGFWYIQRSEDNSFFSIPFGASGDVPVPADYDGDGKTDVAVFRPSSATWFILNSNGWGTTIVNFGSAEDKPVAADYDGDGKSDIAIFRPSDGSWWYLRSIDSQFRVYRFGVSTDKPVPGDYTGDGKADIAVFRPLTGEWFVQRSEDNSFYSVPFGASGDLPAPGDYDGDGKFDPAVFRPATANWFVQRSTAGILITGFGTSGDRPIPNSFVP